MKANTMTAAEARSFDTYSVGNAVAVKQLLECGCEPYQDVFTFVRWKAQGFHVKRGEHGVRLAVIRRVEIQTDNDELETVRQFGRAIVFCRHQVEANH